MKLRAAIAGAGLMGYWHAKNLVRCGGEVVANKFSGNLRAT
jgi:prephenate dehydrogenase